jgi:hypothetical protein
MSVTLYGGPGGIPVGPEMFERIDAGLALLEAGLPL